MKLKQCLTRSLTAICMMSATPAISRADEGMWLFSEPPRQVLKERHQFEPSEQWLTHLQQSAVRFNSGGSGSFVSNTGLVMTNHHVAADALQKLSTADRDLFNTGFYAAKQSDEAPCVDLELNVLMSMDDVTDRISGAVKPEMSAAESQLARNAAMNTLEQESLKATGLRSDVVTLYQGGRYHLYRYKKYTDVRLVFAPERAVAYFGGDPDNFEYPRYDLDVSFFRAYENGQPAKIEHWLNWNTAGLTEGELVFVAGHPGRTERLNTTEHLKFLRDVSFPWSLDNIRRHEVLLSTYSERTPENARRAQDDLFGYQNSRKAMLGGLTGLQDPRTFMQKAEDESKLGEAAQKLREAIAAALKVHRSIFQDLSLLEQRSGFGGRLFDLARTLVRLADEQAKPNAERLREYRESNQESLKQELFSEAPIYSDLETRLLASSLSFLAEKKGGDAPLVMNVLNGKSPRERAAELVAGSKLADPAFRKQLAEGGVDAIAASDDPMIRLARSIDAEARTVRKTYEQQVQEPMRQAYAQLTDLRFKALGQSTYPDATFTVGLAFGAVSGYTEGDRQIPPFTTLGEAFGYAAAHKNEPPFQLPPSWMKHKDDLNLDVPFNFVSTADIIGGNSGSPVVNREGELVGIIFDGNSQSLVLDFAYTDQQARAVSVYSGAIIEALRKVYSAGALTDELMPPR